MKVLLTPAVKEKLRYYVEGVKGEISGLGKIEFNGDNCIIVDIRIFEQEVSAAAASLDGTSIAKFSEEMIKSGESLKGWNLWWHSHADMGVFWSGVDTGTMDENPLDMQFMLSLVTNKKHEYKARLDVYSPVHLYLDDIEVGIYFKSNKKIKDLVDKEIKEKVKEPVINIPKKTYYNKYNYNNFFDKGFKKKEKTKSKKNKETEKIINDKLINNKSFEEEAYALANNFTLEELEEKYIESTLIRDINLYDRAISIKEELESSLNNK